MNDAGDPSLRTLFVEAIDIADEPGRSAYLDQHCGIGTPLRSKVEALIRAHQLPGGFLPEGPTGPLSGGTPWPEEGPGTVIGPYHLQEKLGEGGWGVVYVAEQVAPMRRTVALKLIKPGMDTRQVLARFEVERRALALMDHPHIATVLDAGATVRGRPFFVMERVHGTRITEFCDREHLDVPQRIALLIQICHAVQHAHQKGIIHRDLKPSNILVARRDGIPTPKVIDFGIAKSTEGAGDDDTVLSPAQPFLGTPAYVSPEQVAGGVMDTRSDIYSLGVLLYELLTGTTPFDGREWMKSGMASLRKQLAEVDPPTPSARVRSLHTAEGIRAAVARSTTPSRWTASLTGDLDAIVMKCLEKDPARRYETAHALGQDLRRHLTGEPVLARPSGVGYRLHKWMGRNRLVVSAAGGILVALWTALGFSTWAWRREAAARAAEAVQRTRAEAGERIARRAGYVADMNLAQIALERNQLGRVREILTRSVPGDGHEDLRQWEWRWLDRMSRGDALSSVGFSPAPVVRMAITRRGEWIVREGSGTVRVLEGSTRKPLLKVEGGSGAKVLALSGDTQTAAWDHRLPDGTPCIQVWRSPWTEPVASLALGAAPLAIALSHSAEHLAVFQGDGTVRLYDVAKGVERGAMSVAKPEGIHKGTVVYSPGDSMLALGGTDGWIHLLDPGTLKILRSWQASKEGLTALAFSPDGSRLASGAGFSDATIRLWDPARGSAAGVLEGHASWVSTLAFSHDGHRLASAGGDGTVRIWNMDPDSAATPRRAAFRGHVGEIDALAWSPDDQTVLSGGRDGRILTWDPRRSPSEGGSVTVPLAVASFQFMPEGRSVVAVDWEGRLVVCSLPHTGAMTVESRGRIEGTFGEVQLSRDGSRMAVGSDTGNVEIRDGTGRRRLALGTAGASIPILLRHQPEPDIWWIVDALGGVRRWRGEGPIPGAAWHMPPGLIAASLSPDFQSIAGVHRDGSIHVLRAEDGKRLAAPIQAPGPCLDLLHAPDGRTFVTAGEEGIVRIWDAATGRPVNALRGHQQTAWSVAFSPDGRRLATGGQGVEAVKLWDPELPAEVGTLRGEGARFYRLHFSNDGRYVGAVARGGALHLWEADPPMKPGR